MYGGAVCGNEIYADFYLPIVIPPPVPLPVLQTAGLGGAICGNEIYADFYLPIVIPPPVPPPSVGGFGGGGFDQDYTYYDYDSVAKEGWILVPRIELEKYRRIPRPEVGVILIGEMPRVRMIPLGDKRNDKNRSN